VNLRDQLRRDEGVRFHPYKDTVGRTTIGVGRNLDDTGITLEEANFLLDNDIARAEASLAESFPWTDGLDDIRKAVLVNMVFNMGVHGLSQFKETLSLVREGKYEEASHEMLNSTWAQQVGPRAFRLSQQLREGVWV
jgi:lysozyme